MPNYVADRPQVEGIRVDVVGHGNMMPHGYSQTCRSAGIEADDLAASMRVVASHLHMRRVDVGTATRTVKETAEHIAAGSAGPESETLAARLGEGDGRDDPQAGGAGRRLADATGSGFHGGAQQSAISHEPRLNARWRNHRAPHCAGYPCQRAGLVQQAIDRR